MGSELGDERLQGDEVKFFFEKIQVRTKIFGTHAKSVRVMLRNGDAMIQNDMRGRQKSILYTSPDMSCAVVDFFCRVPARKFTYFFAHIVIMIEKFWSL